MSRDPSAYALQAQLERSDARVSELDAENRRLRERVANLDADNRRLYARLYALEALHSWSEPSPPRRRVIIDTTVTEIQQPGPQLGPRSTP